MSRRRRGATRVTTISGRSPLTGRGLDMECVVHTLLSCNKHSITKYGNRRNQAVAQKCCSVCATICKEMWGCRSFVAAELQNSTMLCRESSKAYITPDVNPIPRVAKALLFVVVDEVKQSVVVVNQPICQKSCASSGMTSKKM